jgi:hypothetical protein
MEKWQFATEVVVPWVILWNTSLWHDLGPLNTASIALSGTLIVFSKK